MPQRFDKNTRKDASSGEVVGDTKRGLGDYGKLNDRLQDTVSFAMDEVTRKNEPVKEENILEFIRMQVILMHIQ